MPRDAELPSTPIVPNGTPQVPDTGSGVAQDVVGSRAAGSDSCIALHAGRHAIVGTGIEAQSAVWSSSIAVVRSENLAHDSRLSAHGWGVNQDDPTDGVGPVPSSGGTTNNADGPCGKWVNLRGMI